jgi:LysM repeat protein
MFVTTDASGAVPTIYWTESGALMKAELRPPVTSTSSSAPATNESITYRVADGDDVTAIADRFSMAVWELELANPQIKDFSSMEPGTILTIPAPGSQDTFQYVVVAGDDLQSISDRFNVRLWELEFANPRFSAIDEPPVGTILTIPAPASQANVPTPLPMPSTFQYRVIAGDSAQSIADKFAVQLRDLESANPQIHDFTYLPVGTVLNIPLPIFRAPSTASPNPS